MYSHFFIGLFLVAFQFAYYNCAPGRPFSERDLSIDLPLEEKHSGKHALIKFCVIMKTQGKNKCKNFQRK